MGWTLAVNGVVLTEQMHQLFHSDSTTCVAHDKIQMKDIPIKRQKKILGTTSSGWMEFIGCFFFILSVN